MAKITQLYKTPPHGDGGMEEYKRKLFRHRAGLGVRLLICAAVVLAVALGVWFWFRNRTYTAYEVVSSVEYSSAIDTQYAEYNGQLLRYSRDGVSCINSQNEAVWSQTYNMQYPVVDICESSVAVADQQGNEVYVFGPDGLRDFESITALNVELLADRVHKLCKGEEVPRRKFNFKDGIGYDVEEEKQKLGEKTFLILEGIHGLNPELLMHLGRDEVVPIYVAPLTPLSIDNTHRFPTTDLRLIRRIIRDHKYRGYSARKTIGRWTSVRVGEEKNIFPYQGNSEMFFNSSLVYELPVLSIFARSLLAEATVPEPDENPNDPVTKEITREARRLLGLANLFYAIPLQDVPHISCIREFTGGSDLKY